MFSLFYLQRYEMKDLGRIVANSPDGLKNNPIFKELVNEITKNKEKESQK